MELTPLNSTRLQLPPLEQSSDEQIAGKMAELFEQIMPLAAQVQELVSTLGRTCAVRQSDGLRIIIMDQSVTTNIVEKIRS